MPVSRQADLQCELKYGANKTGWHYEYSGGAHSGPWWIITRSCSSMSGTVTKHRSSNIYRRDEPFYLLTPEIAARCHKYRLDKGVTVSKVIQLCSCAKQSITHIEHCRRATITQDLYNRLRKFYGSALDGMKTCDKPPQKARTRKQDLTDYCE
jgi:hypothetical protein